ncbi:MAG TPA: tRNA pseudouridine(38-40) synthase TruA [Gemmatimonadales bacterium]|nr:tRNA pseudouridine(38-40) synthase TruA [Gemmatimonadales bacterium]
MRTLKLTLAYDGTDFVGWQRQAAGVSVQGLLEEVLSRIEGAPVVVHGAGRTDSGVHAVAQVASVTLRATLDPPTLRRALNASLPVALRVLAVEEAVDGFHARYSATGKTYHYRILHGPVASSFAHRYTWHIPFALDWEAMRDAARLVVGTHDFAAFQSTGSDVQSSVRTISTSRFEIQPIGHESAPALAPVEPLHDATLLRYVVSADGFLRHMVRAIVGTLVEVGAGRMQAGAVSRLLASGRRDLAGPTAPPRGLCLAGVDYGATGGTVATQR